MKKNTILLLLTVLVLPGSVIRVCAQKAVPRADLSFRNTGLSTEQRIDLLISQLSLEEKAGLMMNNSRAVPRLGIPAYDWWNEALHGVARAGRATVFPQAIGMAATWNEELHKKTFDIISDEARAKYNEAQRKGESGRYYGLSFWTPNINIFRDPRWGRGQETYGEDPYLTSRLGLMAVKGLQGQDPRYFKTHACAKHFAVHSGPEWNRHSYDARVSARDLWETYLPAFRALVKEGNVQEVMCAYNAIQGQPCCGSDLLLMDILRKRWGYKGLIISDCWAINDFYERGHHATSPDAPSAAADAVSHSTDLECGPVYANLVSAVKRGLISVDKIDESLRRVLRAWFELGMLDPADMVPWSKLPYSVVDAPAHREQALRVARESVVLLKNSGNVLPLSKEIRKIAIVGANANDSIMLWGNYNGLPSSSTTILQGIKNKLPGTELIYERGCDLVDPYVYTSLMNHIHADAGGPAGIKIEFFNNTDLRGPAAHTEYTTAGIQLSTNGGTALAEGINMLSTSTRISGELVAPESGELLLSVKASDNYRLYVDDSLVLSKSGKQASMPDNFMLKVRRSGRYRLRLEQVQGGSTVNISFDCRRREPVDFAGITKRIQDADVIIYAGGLSPALEGEEMPVNAEGFRGGDKVSIDLPAVQRSMLEALRKTGKPVIFVLCTGSALALAEDEPHYDALLCAWYGGQSAGTAVADVLFGDYNPAGRLPVTFYKSLQQLEGALSKTADPARQGFENYDMTGRTYRYMEEMPLYAFGHGLSYSKFRYERLKAESATIKAGDPVRINVNIVNFSSVDGDEVAQVYVSRKDDPEAPKKSLRAFSRIHIPAGGSISETFVLDGGAFSFYSSKDDDLIVKKGNYVISCGGASDKDYQQITVELK